MNIVFYKKFIRDYLDIKTANDEKIHQIAEAMKSLHSAICYLDNENLSKFNLDKSLKSHLSDFAEVEQLRSFRDKKELTLTTTGEILKLL